MHIFFRENASFGLSDVDVVERKGIGHPDTLCDAIAEKASCYYAQYCLEHFGRVAHHWFDKVMLAGGASEIDFGKAKLIFPYTVIFAGKACKKVADHVIPVEAILTQAAQDVLTQTLFGFDPQLHLKTQFYLQDNKGPGQKKSRYCPESVLDLVDLNTLGVSNDCNLCVAYAPLSPIEKTVLSLEKEITTGSFKKDFPDTGYDVKIVATRNQNQIFFSVNLPFLAIHIPDYAFYQNRVFAATEWIQNYLNGQLQGPVEVVVNPEKTSKRAYLTVTGSVADTGDIGVVGRGNRINGLITPLRPMSIEASSGKNPLDHTGKLYGILVNRLAEKIYEKTHLHNTVVIVTSKESAVVNPDTLFVFLPELDKNKDKWQKKIEVLIQEAFFDLPHLPRELILKGVVQW
jgi:S-adenosylmethionine synthetase